MQYVALDKEPNQSFTVPVENRILMFVLRHFRGATYVTVTSSVGETIVVSRKATNKGWLFPERYEREIGNFRFSDENDEYPTFENFNSTCVMEYFSPSEMFEIRSGERAR